MREDKPIYISDKSPLPEVDKERLLNGPDYGTFRSSNYVSKENKDKTTKIYKADYGDATPEQVARAVLTFKLKKPK